ncbi:MAG: transposase [Victivallales bacterium]|nr:transposase [Victivallales bacterium]
MAQELAGANPTDRGKQGSKKNLLVDAVGIPLSIVVTGANRHDAAVLDELLKPFTIPEVPEQVVVPWILSQRGEATPIEPPEIVDAVRKAASAILDKITP